MKCLWCGSEKEDLRMGVCFNCDHNTKVISAFPATGKSYICSNNIKCLDSDSSSFSWISKGVKNPDFPNNYINHIKDKLSSKEYDVIFVSSHKILREALVLNNIPFLLVYPNIKNKIEYLIRYKNRGNDMEFISMMDKNWDTYINDCSKQNNCAIEVLGHGKYLSDLF